jgi:glucose/arabinose dehydrogenase
VPDKFKKGTFSTPRTLTVPNGFEVSLYALLDNSPRMLAYSPDGQLFVTETDAGKVVVIKDNNGIGSDSVIFSEGLDRPHGLAFYKDPADNQTYLYVAETGKVSRFTYSPNQQHATNRKVLVNNIPTGGNHVTRTLAFGPDNKMYVSVGSSCNVCEDTPLRADVLQFNPDGSGERVFAAGLRNGVGLTFNPTTGQLWETENGRDEIGNDMPPEEINILQDSKNYGWPYCYSNQVWDQDFGKRDQAFCNTTVPPALPMQAHSAPLGISFYMGNRFPTQYQGAAFVGFHGSWNRDRKTGYKVVSIVVQAGKPVAYQDFATGWLDWQGQDNWGRPVDPLPTPDGSLLVSDDQTGAIYKFSYQPH